MADVSPPSAAPDRRELLKNAFEAIEQLKAKVKSLESAAAEPIAIIGAGCRFPGNANNLDSYWDLLRDGRDVVQEIPAARWETLGHTGVESGWYAGLVDGLDQFDPRFFGISAREATTMDPQQRMVLEVGWEALEHAGHAPDQLRGSRTGVFLGVTGHDYGDLLRDAGGLLDVYAATGNANNAAAGRLSFFLGLQGPSLAVDTACSSSLVAIHLACLALKAGECTMALAGGVNALLAPWPFECFRNWGMMAPDGQCKAFDAQANGFVRGEGCGIVVLKRLSQARADGDRILAVIRGSAVNQDGRSSGLTVPNGPAQEAVVQQALATGRVNPLDVQYVEAHGTGTSLGDPIEAHALAEVLGPGRTPDNPLIVGSVKTNLGHLESAAGIAGLLKVVVSLQNEQIPAHLHFTTMNPDIDWNDVPVEIPVHGKAWARTTRPRLAGVSSFGFSGTNAHLVIEEAPHDTVSTTEVERQLHVFTLSARSDAARDELVTRTLDTLDHTNASLADLGFTANTGRAQLSERIAVIADTRETLRERLQAKRWITGHAKPGGVRIAGLFTGQGAQWAGMGKALYDTQPVFRDALNDCASRLSLEHPLLDVMYGAQSALLNQTAYTQPALFALEWALAHLWKSWGIEPEVVLGHSVGEYAALCVAGVWTLDDGLRLIAERGRLMQSLGEGWGMTSVLATRERVTAALQGAPATVSIAAVNGPESIVLSGPLDALREVEPRLTSAGIVVKPLTVSHGFHSAQMESITETFAQLVQRTPMHAPRMRIVSSVTGQFVTLDDLRTPDYWRRQVRNAVEFYTGMRTLAEAGYETFLEIGPAATLTGLGRQGIGRDGQLWAPSLRADRDAWELMLDSLGALYVNGATVDWAGFDAPYHRSHVTLPSYPFQRQRYWIEDAPHTEGTSRTTDRPRRTSASAPAATAQDPESTASDDWFYQVDWHERAPDDTGSGPRPDAWIILASSKTTAPLATALAAHIQRDGVACAIVSTRSPNDLHAAIARHPSASIVDLWHLEPHDASSSMVKESVAWLALIQALAGTARTPIWIATRGVQPVESMPGVDALPQAPLWGLGRTLAVEHPELYGGLVDLDPNADVETSARALWRHLRATGGEDQVALRGDRRFVARLTRYTPPPAQTAPPVTLRTDGTYLVTGGSGGLGLAAARWLVEAGARRLLLVSRTAIPERTTWASLPHDHPRAAAVESIRALEALGAAIHLAAVDVTDTQAMRHTIEEFERHAWPPIRGVVHAAGVLRHHPLVELTPTVLGELLRPKTAAWRLHNALHGRPLDFFVLFSSASSLLSSPKLGAYAAGNAFMDTFAHYRRGIDASALSIDWGVWGETGMASRFDSADLGTLSSRGMGAMRTAQGLDALARLIGGPASHVAVMPVDWQRWAELFPSYTKAPLLAELFKDTAPRPASTTSNPALDALRAAPSDARAQPLQQYLASSLGGILGFSATDVDPQLSISAFGLDSLTAVELRNRIEAELGVPLSTVRLLQGPAITELVQEIEPLLSTELLGGTGQTGAASTPTNVDALSDAEVDAALAALLQGDGPPHGA